MCTDAARIGSLRADAFFGTAAGTLALAAYLPRKSAKMGILAPTVGLQGFRKNNNSKLSVKPINANVYHYGWVRPPHLMQNKKKVHDGLHRGIVQAEKEYKSKDNIYDYGPLGKIPKFPHTHPIVMRERIKKMDWNDTLNHTNFWVPTRPLNKHEKKRYRALTWIENNILGSKEIFGYKNWNKQ